MADIALTEAPDAVLVRRAVDGDVTAFEVLLRRYAPMMVGYAAKFTGSRSDADDVVQEAFITAWDRLGDLADGSAVRSWLMRIVSRKAIDRVRSRKIEPAIADWDAPAPPSESPESQAVVQSEIQAVAHQLSRLPEMQRQCWILKEIGGYSYQEIADELDQPLSTVRGCLARARQTLLHEMEDWND